VANHELIFIDACLGGATVIVPIRKRGRPSKFDRPSRLLALTLPEDVIDGLRKINTDLAWAIVTLVQQQGKHGKMSPASAQADAQAEAALVGIPDRQFLIVVDRTIFKRLPNVNLIPLNGNHAFLALNPGSGVSDLELAVVDRLDEQIADRTERDALIRLRSQLRRWRRDRGLAFDQRTIIVGRRAKGRRR
jgi:hypothetical protein